jgi:hypothetical protein
MRCDRQSVARGYPAEDLPASSQSERIVATVVEQVTAGSQDVRICEKTRRPLTDQRNKVTGKTRINRWIRRIPSPKTVGIHDLRINTALQVSREFSIKRGLRTPLFGTEIRFEIPRNPRTDAEEIPVSPHIADPRIHVVSTAPNVRNKRLQIRATIQP